METSKIKLATIAISLLVSGVVIGGIAVSTSSNKSSKQQTRVTTPVPAPVTDETGTENQWADGKSPTDPWTEALRYKPTPVMTAETVTPIWSSEKTELKFKDFFSAATVDGWKAKLSTDYQAAFDDASKNASFWINGKTTFGGKEMESAVLTDYCNGLDCNSSYTIALIDREAKTVYVPNTTSQASDLLISFFTPAPNLKIVEPVIPETLHVNGVTLRETSRCFNAGGCGKYFFGSGNGSIKFDVYAKSDEGFDVLKSDATTNSPCFYVISGSGSMARFTASLVGEDLSATPANNYGRNGTVIPTNWKTGYENTISYSSASVGGCGSQTCSDVVSAKNLGPEKDLIIIGTTKNGESLYGPKNYATHPITIALYDTWYPVGGADKPTLAEFLKDKKAPFFFWKDGFGRWIEYKDVSIQPMAECGKPVVYLYPTKITPVHVELPSFIHVTKSEPTYPSAGWNVVAKPSGELTNTDGSVWPNLYWDGIGVNYPIAKTGFIVKDGGVEKFFASTLPKYGLNAQESKDFTEFWLPYFKGANYYRISFLTSEWSKAAPMSVVPRPDTSIRIFMDWQKLEAPISIPAPIVKTPARSGFTLVEWGGAIPR
ncbi:MAG: hypothetical protein WCJ29_04715 [bacterium]